MEPLALVSGIELAFEQQAVLQLVVSQPVQHRLLARPVLVQLRQQTCRPVDSRPTKRRANRPLLFPPTVVGK